MFSLDLAVCEIRVIVFVSSQLVGLKWLFLCGGALHKQRDHHTSFKVGVLYIIAESRTKISGHLKHIQNKNLKDRWYLNEARKCCRMFPLHARIQEFLSGGVQVWWPENSLNNVFCVFFQVFNLFYSLQRESNGFITERTIICQGSNNFQGGPNLKGSIFSRGVQMLISTETHVLWDFPGGSGSLSPHWMRTCLGVLGNTFDLH